MKTVWIINQDGSTPETGYGGRHHYFARELGRRGYRVYFVIASWHHLLNVSNEPLPRFEKREHYTVVRIPVLKYGHSHSPRRLLNWELFRLKIPRLLEEIPHAPDVIYYSSLSLIGYLGAEKVARKTGARLVFEVRDIWPLSLMVIRNLSPRHPLVWYMQRIEDRAYRNSDAVISNLRNAVDHMVSRGMDPGKFTWIPNGVSVAEKSDPHPLPTEVSKQLPKGKFIVGYAGSINSGNSPEYLIHAAGILKPETDVAFVIVGRGREKARLEKLIRDLELENVTMIDPIPKQQVPSMLAEFDACYIGLSPEPLFRFGVSPNKLFDYLASGRPIIYAIDSGAYKPVQEAGAGIEIAPNDPIALSKAILELKALPQSERDAMGARGVAEIARRYSYESLVLDLERVLFPELAAQE